MLTLKRKHLVDLSELEMWIISAACEEIDKTIDNNSLLKKYYSKLLANIEITLNNDRVFFIMYVNELPIGAIGISKVFHPYLIKPFFNEDFLYILPEHRSFKSLMFLLRSTLDELNADVTEPALMTSGNMLGTHNVQVGYLRAGFTLIGTSLVKELGV